MEARVSYNDFIGTAAADISDGIGKVGANSLDQIADYFKLDKVRFKIVGLSFYGTTGFSVSMICVDKILSTFEKEHIVSMSIEVNDVKGILSALFKHFMVVLHDKYDEKYVMRSYDSEVRFADYHKQD